MPKQYQIAVIDGQGGGIGKNVVAQLKKEIPEIKILALGTNSTATAQMMKSGADAGATGENAIAVNVHKVDIIIGVVAILAADSMLGELTPTMAREIGASSALKLLIPLNRCGIQVAGTQNIQLPQAIQNIVQAVREYVQ
jgi:hypothetical protein